MSKSAPVIAVSDTVTMLAERAEVPKAHVTAVLRALRGLIVDKGSLGLAVNIGRDFGTFKPTFVTRRSLKVPAHPDKEFQSGGYYKVKFVPSAQELKRLPE